MVTPVLVLLLSAVPVRVAATGLQVTGVEPPVAEAWVERFAAVMAEGGVVVTTQRDVGQILGLERQRQLLGCSDESTSCLAELAGALGVDAVVSGTVVKTGASYLVTLKVLRAKDASVWASASERLRGEDALQDFLDETARAFARTLAGPAATPGPPPSAAVVRWLPGAIGVVAAVSGGVLFGLSKRNADELRRASVDPGLGVDVAATASAGRALEGAGLALLVAGGVGVATSALWLALSPRSDVAVAFVPTPDGPAVSVGGTF